MSMLLLLLGVSGISMPAPQSDKQLERARQAIAAYVTTGSSGTSAAALLEGGEDPALERAVKAVRNLKTAAAALRSWQPLTEAKPGSHHGRTFRSGGRQFEYSIRLPKGYDGKQRFPVLVLPDHASVGAKAGISYWEQDRKLVEEFILFRPVILKHRMDAKVFPERQFFLLDASIAAVMRDALRHLRLHYAVDHDRLVLTGLSQAGYYSYYYAVSFPDEFAGVVPESAGGLAVRAAIRPLARNLTGMQVKLLHGKGDKVTPFSDARLIVKALEAAGGKCELVTFSAGDYRPPNPRQHPIPHHKRIENVLPFALQCKRSLGADTHRVVRYPQQGLEGRFLVRGPAKVQGVFELVASAKDGKLVANREGVTYLVSPEDVLQRRKFVVSKKRVTPRADLRLLLRAFRVCPDPNRLAAARIVVTK